MHVIHTGMRCIGILKAGSRVQILVENMGRINFSHGMDDEVKGLTGNVTLDKGLPAPLGNWTTHCLPLDDPAQVAALPWAPVPATGYAQVRTRAIDRSLFLTVSGRAC